jgi:ubiquinone/menaquinone biosynthesis C-methylase UbiE
MKRMPREPEFRSDLYRGTAGFYDEFRLAYPEPLLDDLRVHAATTGAGRLLDLACGTGQVTFGLASNFVEIWAVDQEPEATDFARAKALRRGIHNVRWIAGRAEDVDADSYFELVTIGNAFHRLPRRAIAESAMRWLVPGGHLALLWSDAPWNGSQAWQRVMADILSEWTQRAAATDRVPDNLYQHLAEEPHLTVLATAGFTIVREFEYALPYHWSVEKLAGFMYSTSVLSQPALGRNVPAFERDLRERLLAAEPEGVFHDEISFAYTLARRP